MMKVPFLDLKSQYLSIKDEIDKAIQQVLDNTAFAGGPFVAQFEKQFAEFCGCKHAIGVGSGTDALWLSLIALGIGEGDEVITVPNTFIATAEAITFCGATPVFVDIEEQTYNMDHNKLEDYLKRRYQETGTRNQGKKPKGLEPETCNLKPNSLNLKPETCNLKPGSRPKAVIPVHLFGQTADMDPILEIARRYDLCVIEDACQAHGAKYKGKNAGTMGDTGCFSFYPGKNLGAYGEAGAIVTNDDALAEKVRMLRDHGQAKKYYHDWIGWNARMDGLQGAVLGVKLKHLPSWNEGRRRNARLYNELLANGDQMTLPKEAEFVKHVYHIYAIRVRNRDAAMAALGQKGIATGIHYPLPLHLTDAYRSLGYKAGDFPVAERCANEFVSLPMYPELTEEQIRYVCNEVKTCFSQSRQR
jgi:dTDP-4-amino-4,6-dideoxygalactose transaminase